MYTYRAVLATSIAVALVQASPAAHAFHIHRPHIHRPHIHVGGSVGKILKKTEAEAKRASTRVLKEVKREGEDLAVAVKQTGYFVDRQQRGLRDQVMDLESNVRHGEFDRVAGFTFYSWKDTSDHAARSMQESAVLRGVGQVAASAYLGPGGSAAFSTWYTYTASGDIESALRVGAVTLAASAAVASISGAGAGPDSSGDVSGVARSMSIDDIAGRALATGTVGAGSAVALGADQGDVEKAFLLGAATSASVDIYEKTTGAPLDARAPDKPAVCKLGPMGAACAPAAEAYVEVSPGEFKLDIKRLPPRLDQVGLQVGEHPDWWLRNVTGEGSTVLSQVAKIPGMGGMGVLHDIVAADYPLPLLVPSIQPAIAFTYVATGAPLSIELADAAIENE